MSCHVTSCHVMSCHAMSRPVMSCHVHVDVTSCHVIALMSCHVMSCHVSVKVVTLWCSRSSRSLGNPKHGGESCATVIGLWRMCDSIRMLAPSQTFSSYLRLAFVVFVTWRLLKLSLHNLKVYSDKSCATHQSDI